MLLTVEKCKDNPRTTWVVLVYYKIYSALWPAGTAGQPVWEDLLYSYERRLDVYPVFYFLEFPFVFRKRWLSLHKILRR